MQSYAHGAGEVPLIGEPIGLHFDRIAAAHADREALVSRHQGIRLTYAQLRAATDAFARGLMALGVEHGDRVGIWATNCAEWVVAQFATPKIGAVLVNVNPAYRATEAEFALKQSGVSVLLMQVRYRDSDYARILSTVRPALPGLRTVVLIGDDELEQPLEGAMRWADVESSAAPTLVPIACANGSSKRSSTIQSTSSTRPERPGSPRARRSRITTSSTTGSSSARAVAIPPTTGSAFRSRSITASAWCSRTWPA
jgi:acyl-CoA synthetase (AMP-forming)/AMP-acid ligase II